MKGSRKGVLGVALAAVIAIGAITPGLQAEPSAMARFKLPFEAQVGATVLPAGSYTLLIDGAGGAYGTIAVYREGQALGFMVPQTLDTYRGQDEKPAALLCIRHDGKVTVRALRLPKVGTYYFQLPKELKMLVAQQPQLVETVPVQMSGE